MVAFPWSRSFLLVLLSPSWATSLAFQVSSLRLEPPWTRPRLIDGSVLVPGQKDEEPSGVGGVSTRVNDVDTSEKLMVSTSMSMSMSILNDARDEHVAKTGVLSSPSFPPSLLFLVPEKSPIAWTAVNNTLAISGCILIMEMVLAKGDPYARPFATAFYLIWEFAICFFWTLETTLSSTYQIYHLQEPNLPWYTKLEIIIAAYFMVTTFWMLKQWDIMDQPILDEDIGELVLDASFYLYLAVRRCHQATIMHDKTQPIQFQLHEQTFRATDRSYQKIASKNDTVGVYV
jgi:hypothetical protein